jgi:transposase
MANKVSLFRGRRGDLIKVIWFDGQGSCLFSKRLERGRFVWPAAKDGKVALTPAQLAMLLEGEEGLGDGPVDRHPRRKTGGPRSARGGRCGRDRGFPQGSLTVTIFVMLDEATALPDDPDDLRSLAERLIAEVKARAVLIEKLRHQLAGHRAHRFGASAETAEQLQLAPETSELAAAAMTAKLRLPEPPEEKGTPKRRPIPDHVPRTEIELPPAQDDCAACGGGLRRVGEDGGPWSAIGPRTMASEELEYVPGRFVVNRIARPRFACSGCERFTQAPLPSRPIERGRPGPGLLAHVPVGKYADHLPL